MKLKEAVEDSLESEIDPATARQSAASWACLAMLRSELEASYPAINKRRLIAILRRFRMDRFPEGFLVSGSLRDRTPDGARAQITKNADGNSSSSHPLFSQAFYLATNPDVAGVGVSPWLHYQVHGRAEGRSPHPLIDVKYLGASLPETPTRSIVDEYLTDPAAWIVDPGPYVDSRKFLLYGNWDGSSHPLSQIVTKHLGGPWVHRRLLLIDSDSDSATARLAGIGYLVTRSHGMSRFAAIESWSLSNAREIEESAGERTVIPGYFFGKDGKAIVVSTDGVVSPDGTAVRVGGEFLSVRAGQTRTADRLVYIASWLDRDSLANLVTKSSGDTVIAPHNSAQETALRELTADRSESAVILESGVQLRVISKTVQVVRQAPGPVPAWDPAATAVGTTRVAIVLGSANYRQAAQDERIANALDAGATLCLLGAEGLAPWLPIIQSRDIIVCEQQLEQLVLSFTSRERVLSLSPDAGQLS